MSGRSALAWFLSCAALCAEPPTGGSLVAWVGLPWLALAGLPLRERISAQPSAGFAPVLFAAPIFVLAGRVDLAAGFGAEIVGIGAGATLLLACGLATAAARAAGAKVHALLWLLLVPGLAALGAAAGLAPGGLVRGGSALAAWSPLAFTARAASGAGAESSRELFAALAPAFGSLALLVLAAEGARRAAIRSADGVGERG